MKTDCIAAVATAMSDSGIGIIRVSGDEAISIVDKIYRNKYGRRSLQGFASHTIHYGFIEDDDVLDEVMVSLMRAPNSYTAEDTVEINCHGGVLMVNRILESVVKNGARIAQPGEFTKRAFLNGRIDLSEAEAVMDVIHSRNQFALKSSVGQLRGSVSDLIKIMRDEIIYEIAFIESALDDPEHISLDGYTDKLSDKTEDILKRLKRLLDSWEDGKLLKEGIHTVILGKPNAGKSSLLNLLTGEDKAIVTDIPGTTRDALLENIRLGGISLNIIDTAGIRFTEDVVEKIGVEKAKRYASEADLIIYVVDASLSLDESDFDIMNMISGKKTIVLLNKNDLNAVVSEDIFIGKMYEVLDADASEKEDICKDIYFIKTSTKNNSGMDILEEKIKDLFFHGEISFNDEVVITNMRHKEAIEEAYESMEQVALSILNGMPEDFYSIDLMSCYSSLGAILGEEVGEDLVNEIFSRFCMGK